MTKDNTPYATFIDLVDHAGIACEMLKAAGDLAQASRDSAIRYGQPIRSDQVVAEFSAIIPLIEGARDLLSKAKAKRAGGVS